MLLTNLPIQTQYAFNISPSIDANALGQLRWTPSAALARPQAKPRTSFPHSRSFIVTCLAYEYCFAEAVETL